MPIYINSTKLGSEAYNVHGNSTKLNKIMLGNIKVWEGLPPYYSDLKNGTILTESQWLEFLNGGGIAKVIQLNDQANFRGKQVQVENSQTQSYKNWIIADFNHDNTSGTCDLIQANTIKSSFFGYSNNYSSSSLRDWIVGTYYRGFSDSIRDKMITMAVSSNNNILNDKVKILSMSEVGNSNVYIIEEGTKYPIFTSSSGSTANSSRVRSGYTNKWWLRTCHPSISEYVYCVMDDGGFNLDNYTSYNGVVPCIRFA